MKLNLSQTKDSQTQSSGCFITFNLQQMSILSVFILTSEKNTNDIPPDKVALYKIKVFFTS